MGVSRETPDGVSRETGSPHPASSAFPTRPEVAARLDALTATYRLDLEAPLRLALLLDLVAAEPQAITSVRDPVDAVEVHVADSLAGLQAPALRDATRIADLGSGGGFPGLVLAIALPAAHVTLVESVGKKAAFLRTAANAAGVGDRVEVVPRRAEDWPEGIGVHDIVTARAVAPLGVLLEYAAPLLREGGTLVAWKSRPAADEMMMAAAAAAALAMTPPAAVDVPSDAVRHVAPRSLYLSSKVGPTPPGYPRRAGMARKRPIGPST